jgi:hypothetical protein
MVRRWNWSGDLEGEERRSRDAGASALDVMALSAGNARRGNTAVVEPMRPNGSITFTTMLKAWVADGRVTRAKTCPCPA